MIGRMLTPYRGFDIEKTWELNRDGTIKKSTVNYSAFLGLIDEDCYLDSADTLAEIKKKIDAYWG